MHLGGQSRASLTDQQCGGCRSISRQPANWPPHQVWTFVNHPCKKKLCVRKKWILRFLQILASNKIQTTSHCFSFKIFIMENSKTYTSKKKANSTHVYCCYFVAQLCLTLCDPKDCSPPGSSVHGILQARILEWVAISFSRGSSQPRDQVYISCIGRWFL